jgi:hypothetical protein
MIGRYSGLVADETGEAFDIVVCPRCGMGRTSPQPADLSPYYPRIYYGNRHGLTAGFCNRRRMNVLRRWMGPGSGRPLLDWGCGDGDFLRTARREGWMGWGLERHVRGSGGDDPPIVDDLGALAGRPPFACTTFWHVLEHLDDPIDVLTRLRSVLAPGGLVLAAVPNFGSLQSRILTRSWPHLDIPRHLHHFTKTSLIGILEMSGYRVEGVSYGELEYDVVGWSQGVLNRTLGDRNEFLHRMSGRSPSGRRGLGQALRFVIGLGLSAVAVPTALVESRIGRGGTLIAAARSVSR